jgi:hypothetical protein
MKKISFVYRHNNHCDIGTYRITPPIPLRSVLWIRIRKDQELFAGSEGMVTRGYGFGSKPGLGHYQKS